MEQAAHKRRKTGNAPYTLLSCCLCESKKKLKEQDYKYEGDKRFPWAVSISCPDPKHSSWIVCCECERMKTKITKMSQLKAHHKKFHNAKKEKERNAPTSSNKSDAESTIEATTLEKMTNIQQKLLTLISQQLNATLISIKKERDLEKIILQPTHTFI